jgi:hypothetical protein
MQKIDLDALSIEDLATLRDQATEKLADKIAARQRELTAELEKLAVLGKTAKVAAPKKDLKDVKESLKPQASDVSKAHDAPKAQAVKTAAADKAA